MSNRGTRGKYAEGQVHKYLEQVNGRLVNWDYERLGDARSAGGRGAKKVVGDFSFFSPFRFGVVEVKQIAHDFRLPAKNLTQLQKLRKRTLAGGNCYVVVYHSTTKKWRCIPSGEMELRDTGSWDLRPFPEYDHLQDALTLEMLGGPSE